MVDERPFELVSDDYVEPEQESLRAPEQTVVADLAPPAKRRGRPPKATQATAIEPTKPADPPVKAIKVMVKHPYAMHCPTQNVYIRPNEVVSVVLDRWIKNQLDAGLLQIIE
jgi:hypothetical protein